MTVKWDCGKKFTVPDNTGGIYMNKMFKLLTILMLVALTATGCGSNSLAGYKKAVEKTAQIEKGQCSAEFSMVMDFNTAGMSQEDMNQLNYYSRMSGNFQSAFDERISQGIYRSYMNLGGLGFDFDVYKNGEEVYAKLPVIGKYMRMDDLLKEAGESGITGTPGAADSKVISDDTLQALGAEWVGMLKEKDVFKGKDIILTTPDGEVKTTVYTITLNDSQLKDFEVKAVAILSQDENLRSSVNTIINQKSGLQPDAEFDELITKIKKYIMEDKLESFLYTAYVDIDGYIVNETIEIEIKRNAREQGEPKSISFRLDMKNWDINKEQQLEFPELTEENTLKKGDLDQTMLSSFKDFFSINK